MQKRQYGHWTLFKLEYPVLSSIFFNNFIKKEVLPHEGNSCHINFLNIFQSVRLYDVTANKQRLTYNHQGPVLDCCFSDGVHSYSGGLDCILKR